MGLERNEREFIETQKRNRSTRFITNYRNSKKEKKYRIFEDENYEEVSEIPEPREHKKKR